jgi:dTDP-4-dehydrorhamnose 3,5-epimerase
MEFRKLGLPGLTAIQTRHLEDRRGSFTKIFHSELFEQAGLKLQFVEQYISISHKNVVRGLHFQVPPRDHAKLVYCASGRLLDVVVDLRTNSPTYGQAASLELSESSGSILYVPSGLAHGFASLTDHCVMVCNMTSVYSAEHDAGIRWDSFNFSWPIQAPILSDRDATLPKLADFRSPFLFRGN